MKNMKMHTKLVISFLIVEVLVIATSLAGYLTAGRLLTEADPEGYLHNFRIFSGILLLVSLLIMTYISITVTKAIRVSTRNLSDVAKEIATGKIDVDIHKDNDDEFGEVIDDYKQVIENIRYQAGVIEQISNGNLMVDVKPKSEEDVLGKSLRKMVEQNVNALSGISDAALQVTTSSTQVASASEALAQGSTEQASAIQQITASIIDIAEKTKNNAQEASNAARLITDTIDNVKKGNAQMKDMMIAMEDINKSSESISKIIKVIDDIAFQTNILALNAAVEAARAGEAGKGFAVVAEEVRNLAAKSAAAASETAELIEDSIHKVEAGSKIADDTAQALEEITQVVSQSEAIINGIAEASNYQATAIAQIDQAIEQVSQVVQTNSATSEECAAASVELSNQANRMREMLSIFDLGHGTDSKTERMSNRSNKRSSEIVAKNEQIISLGGDFGKY